MYACILSFYMVGNFILKDLVIFFCLNAVYWGDQISVFLVIKVSDISIKKQISDKDTMFTSSRYFSGFLSLRLIDIKSTKNANVKDDYIKDADV